MEQQALVPYEKEQINLIKQTVAKGVTDLELKLFLYQAQRTGLDPLSKQIHAIKRHNNTTNKDEMAIQTGIDGYRLIADRTGKYAGSDEPIFEVNASSKYPIKATVTVWKMVDRIRCPFTASARWDEYYPGDGNKGFMWRKFPYLMLGKCAEALALRKAFPQELSGVYIHEEMAQADGEVVEAKAEEKVGETKSEKPQILPPKKEQSKEVVCPTKSGKFRQEIKVPKTMCENCNDNATCVAIGNRPPELGIDNDASK